MQYLKRSATHIENIISVERGPLDGIVDEDMHSYVSDLIADIYHFCTKQNIDFEDRVQAAMMYVEADLEESEPDEIAEVE